MEDFNPDALSLEDQNTFATLTRALQVSLAEAERLRAESERLSALRETLTAQLQSSSEAVALYRSEGASNSKTDETQHVTEVSGFDSKDREEEDEDDDDEDEISPGLGAELLPFIEREMRGVNARLKRIEAIFIGSAGAIILLLAHLALK
jgi:Ran GTPase-activating protein (RanGAP) involved in mRNA processing and transport